MKYRRQLIIGTSVTSALIFGLLAYMVWEHPYYLVMILPVSWAIYFSNLFPLAVVMLAPGAIAAAGNKVQLARITLLLIVALIISSIGTFKLFSGKPAETQPLEFFPDGTCRQSSTDTCSAAACVTLLKRYGIHVTEREMAEQAFSKVDRGSHPLGIYRALKLAVKQSASPLNVRYQALEAKLLLSRERPALINVGLLHDPTTSAEAELVEKFQWMPRVLHSVIYLGKENGKVKIADPDFGIEEWGVGEFLLLYTGVAFTLEE